MLSKKYFVVAFTHCLHIGSSPINEFMIKCLFCGYICSDLRGTVALPAPGCKFTISCFSVKAGNMSGGSVFIFDMSTISMETKQLSENANIFHISTNRVCSTLFHQSIYHHDDRGGFILSNDCFCILSLQGRCTTFFLLNLKVFQKQILS